MGLYKRLLDDILGDLPVLDDEIADMQQSFVKHRIDLFKI
jgi:hypothetical protein